jgi:starch phosphorylase
MSDSRTIAYFSMEIGLEESIPTYSGGLGILAGDTILSAADLRVPMVAVTLLHRRGYFYQRLDASGWQTEEPVEWIVEDFLAEMPGRVTIQLEGRSVQLRSWRYEVKGLGGFDVPVYLLDADLPENSEWDRTLTHFLYGGDPHYRLCQEAILGIGGVRMLRALGYTEIQRFHMNEGHAALLTLELLEEEAARAGHDSIEPDDIDVVRRKCIFTTHTPVAAGHDRFPMELVRSVLGDRGASSGPMRQMLRRRESLFDRKNLFGIEDGVNLTYLALNSSHYVNGVAKKHGEVSRLLFAGYAIDAITNGVHASRWVSQPFADLYDRHIPGWRQDNFSLRSALGIPKAEIWQAHRRAKQQLVQFVNRATNVGMDEDYLTLGFARRAAAYKRGDLLFADVDRLRSIARSVGPLQVLYAGKAHPEDREGKELIQRIWRMRDVLRKDIRIAYLENYDMELGSRMASGVDVWLNTPQPPFEASGTSGMKAALNGVPSLSVLDGWWIEGCIEEVTGWAIGENHRGAPDGQDRARDAASLYTKLEQVIVPTFYRDPERFIEIMRHAIALNGSFFNTQRMMSQYVVNAYFR